MLHLHKHNLIHRDLAARNILLKQQGEPKVSDFGMSRLLQVDATAGKTYGNIGPVRWMAPESLKSGIYSVKSVRKRFSLLKSYKRYLIGRMELWGGFVRDLRQI